MPRGFSRIHIGKPSDRAAGYVGQRPNRTTFSSEEKAWFDKQKAKDPNWVKQENRRRAERGKAPLAYRPKKTQGKDDRWKTFRIKRNNF